MADNIGQAFAALAERWDAIFTREMERFATINQGTPPLTTSRAMDASRENFYDAVEALADDRYMRDAVHDPARLEVLAEREEIGTWIPDQHLDHLYRPDRGLESDEEAQTAIDQAGQLQSRMDTLSQETSQPHTLHEQGMEY